MQKFRLNSLEQINGIDVKTPTYIHYFTLVQIRLSIYSPPNLPKFMGALCNADEVPCLMLTPG